MTYNEEQELLQLTRENNVLLKMIFRLIQHNETNDFSTNILANIIGNRIDNRIGYK